MARYAANRARAATYRTQPERLAVNREQAAALRVRLAAERSAVRRMAPWRCPHGMQLPVGGYVQSRALQWNVEWDIIRNLLSRFSSLLNVMTWFLFCP